MKTKIVNNFDEGSNSQVFEGNIVGGVFTMPGIVKSEDTDSFDEEPVSEDLEEEIDRYMNRFIPGDIREAPFRSMEECAIHFANWQKEKMINKACEWLENVIDNGAWIANDVREREKAAIIAQFKEDMEAEK